MQGFIDWLKDIMVILGMATRDRVESAVSVERRLARDRQKSKAEFREIGKEVGTMAEYSELVTAQLTVAKSTLAEAQNEFRLALRELKKLQNAGASEFEINGAKAQLSTWANEVADAEADLEEIREEMAVATNDEAEAQAILEQASDDLAVEARRHGRLVSRVSRNNIKRLRVEAKERLAGLIGEDQENRFEERIRQQQAKVEANLAGRERVATSLLRHQGKLKADQGDRLLGRASELYQQALADAGLAEEEAEEEQAEEEQTEELFAVEAEQFQTRRLENE